MSNYGYPAHNVVPQGSDDPRKQMLSEGEATDRGLKIGNFELSNSQLAVGGGLLGTAAAIGVGAFAFDKYQDSKENKAEQEWGAQNWEQDAHRRQGEYLEAVKANKTLPPVQWVLTEGNSIPQGAIPGGKDVDGTTLYIARAFHNGGVHIGKASSKLKDGAHISYSGKEIAVQKYEILLGFENAVRWIDGEGRLNKRDYKMVEGGRESDGTPIYIGQAHLHGAVTPGKVGESIENGCSVAFDDDEKFEKHYRFLTYA
ncbi:uncharacterized protein EV422DRAFT_529892 [Fimicolochytrium jonesii]|uniref:uncharacterized protein n=1 Tax=Fimicolochytrium jonesii TaxID=1396493 RepID=UPI0022FDEE0B|nr:uncharacterized protein EV422DRAFT_529892 [Fimicolochytrium jonesii]KAI8820723.1 hypothetical protein EV422DRAFT_529892 [Fimicolochytrium jonesii]